MPRPVIAFNNIDNWTKNGVFPTFNNTYDTTTDTNTLIYQGGNLYERIYLPIKCTANQQVVFSAKFCSPSGYNCSYGDSKEYFAITSNQPSNISALSSQTVVASTPLDGSASSTPVLYTVTYTPTTDTTLYLVIDFGYMVDGVQTELVYQEITLEGAVPDISGIWYVEDGRLTHDALRAPLSSLMQPPYLPFWWYVSNMELIHNSLPNQLNHIMTEPYPSFWWYVNNNKLLTGHTPDLIVFGAFSNCVNIKQVSISNNTKYIGPDTFLETDITTVTIASDCTYYDSSFPPDCTINYYPTTEY